MRPENTGMQKHGSMVQQVKCISFINKKHTPAILLILVSFKQIIHSMNGPLNISLETCTHSITDQSSIKASSHANSFPY